MCFFTMSPRSRRVGAKIAGEVLVKITASAMCHTELHFNSGLLDLCVAPVTMGHEIVGRVEAVGEEVASERLSQTILPY